MGSRNNMYVLYIQGEGENYDKCGKMLKIGESRKEHIEINLCHPCNFSES